MHPQQDLIYSFFWVVLVKDLFWFSLIGVSRAHGNSIISPESEMLLLKVVFQLFFFICCCCQLFILLWTSI